MLATPVGSYQPGDSVVHALDARVKSVALIVLMVASFTVTTPAQLALDVAGALAFAAASRVAPGTITRSVAPIVPFALIVAVFNLFVMTGGTTLAQLGPLTLTSGGAWAATLYATRLIVVVTFGALLLLTTTPTALTDAFESLLAPAGRLGMPVHEVSMVLSLALRFVPILSDELQSVMDAQAARGGTVEEGGLVTRLRTLGAVLVPVFAGRFATRRTSRARSTPAATREAPAGRATASPASAAPTWPLPSCASCGSRRSSGFAWHRGPSRAGGTASVPNPGHAVAVCTSDAPMVYGLVQLSCAILF